MPGFILPVLLLVLSGIAHMAAATADGTLLGLRAAAALVDHARAFYAADAALMRCVRDVTAHPDTVSGAFVGGVSDASSGRICEVRRCQTDAAAHRVYRLAATAAGALAGTRSSVYALVTVTVSGGQASWRWHATRPPCP